MTPVCGKRFKTEVIFKEPLLEHSLVHAGEKPHKCGSFPSTTPHLSISAQKYPISGKCYVLNLYWSTQERSHTNATPAAKGSKRKTTRCTQGTHWSTLKRNHNFQSCSKRFKTEIVFKEPLLVQTTEKPHK